MESKSRTSRASGAIASAQTATLLCGVVLAGAALVAYLNSFRVPFIFDDLPAIRDNVTIRDLSSALVPPRGSGLPVSGRPLVNFSLALNHALSADHVASYHVFNLLIHVIAGLTLFGIVRRTMFMPALRPKFGSAALPAALIASLLWLVHPLQAESVTYLVQRAESLMGLCYLLTLYCFIRSTEPGATRVWSVAAVFACLSGMASKEVMASAPVVILLYDRTFVSGSFRDAWRRHARLYIGVAATWILLLGLIIDTGGRGGTAGFATEVPWWSYIETQFVAIARYLGLSLWPAGLTLDYGTVLVTNLALIIPCALLVGALVIGTVFALRRAPAIGFMGACFFAILAPSSSIVPVATQTIAEHRMYLSLAAVLVAAVAAGYRGLGARIFVAMAVGAAALSARTLARNADYHTAISIWADTVAKRPENPRAHCNLGEALFLAGHYTEAVVQFESALRLSPGYLDAHFNLANALLATGDSRAALPHYEVVLLAQPNHARAQHNLANALANAGRLAEAVPHYEAAARIAPDRGDALSDWGNAVMQAGRVDEALVHYEAAVRAEPKFASGHNNLANALAQSGRVSEAIPHYEQALRLQPAYAEAHGNFANALMQAGRTQEAIGHFKETVRLLPRSAEAHNNLGMALADFGDLTAARGHFEEALNLRPDFAPARENLQRLRGLNR